jgi:hypothetical protein
MKSSRRKWLVAGFLFLVVVGWAMGQIDYTRLVAGKRPLFARFSLGLADGGSIQYFGMGYTVTEHHQMSVSPWPAQYAEFQIGPTLDYWTPFMSRENLSFTVETNK